ncbi:hypothetical protein Z052_01810 [Halorubrum sp. C191]|uniref:hypothetical protein n=1 Tax=Halorubrum sp. C191 TaxID=1383842 RepID=UPI000C069049|nr:hypothetical protein [Halorubrum sp. C191]PHQ43898.1 hypothetical protein Z052_01810 [Halorubrum sp. C191]
MAFYQNPEKLTIDDAERLLERFVVDHGDVKTNVTAREILKLYDEETITHNQLRVVWMLEEDSRFEERERSGNSRWRRMWRYTEEDGR